MTISVIIPTYRRPDELRRCLEALKIQTRPADEVITVVRDTDEATRSFLKENSFLALKLRTVTVSMPGQVAALNAGLAEAKGDVIVFTDDDAAPHADWLERIEAHFQADSAVGGVGGRDRVFIEGEEVIGSRCQVPGARCQVGRITWYGRIIGNHHLGCGKVREVDHLKGSNMAFRKEAIANMRFDEQLRGKGAQYRNDLALCLAVKRKGWKIIYDSQIEIDHYYATRFEDDQRGNFDLQAIEDAAFNEMLAFLKYAPTFKRCGYILYSFLVGSIFLPGFLQYLRIMFTGQKQPWKRFCAAMRGRRKAYLAKHKAQSA